jgi:hypothetical protein
MWRDPVVAEVRKIREQLFAECGYDLRRLAERDRELQKASGRKLVTRADLDRERAKAKPEGE